MPESSTFCERASYSSPGRLFFGTVNNRPLMITPMPTRNVTRAGVRNGKKSTLSRARRSVTIVAPSPIADVMTPARILRKRFSAGDSRNFSKCGITSSATRLRSFDELICRILSATAIPMVSRAEIADCVIASGFSSEFRTTRKSVPQARQNWLSWRSSEPQDGQYMSGNYTAIRW